MKITLGQMVQSVESLQKLFNEPLPIKTTFKLKKITQEIDNNLKIYDDSRNSLLKKYGKADKENEGMFIIDPKNQKALDKEHTELTEMEVSLSFEPISSSILGKIQLSSKDLVLLDWLIVE